MGPFRAVGYGALQRLQMRDPDYGWTVEMQIKAAKGGLRVLEVPVSYRRRIGKSKVSGTLRGVVGAGTKILGTIAIAAFGSQAGTAPGCAERKLIIFTRYPEPGRTKTRLIPLLGPEGAADLHRRMTELTVSSMRRLIRKGWTAVEVFHDGDDASYMEQWLGCDLTYVPQGDGDLGLRMLNAFRKSFRDGTDRTVIVGTDCPDLSAAVVEQAFRRLESHDVAVGPAADGGYYLIGARRPHPELFTGVPWGTEEVLETSLRIAKDLGLSVALLDTLHDVDRPEDIHRLNASLMEAAARGQRRPCSGPDPVVSVIIPTLNEEDHIRHSLASALSEDRAEIIVVDGGSTDQTLNILQADGVDVFQSRAGRGSQMNAGASRASGEILLFLHADTVLPDGWYDHVLDALASPDVVGGAFRLRIDANFFGLRVIERLANFRSARMRMPYGDQAIFLRKEAFDRIGGFPEMPLLEDLEFVRKLRKLGRLKMPAAAVLTSARRWRNLGIWRTTVINQLVLLGHFLGIPVDNLARLYHKSG
ncbi:MAG: TIGR04283 family arsenosugar biosynthesis glycosyltransferase [Pseudomonadota bacterium]